MGLQHYSTILFNFPALVQPCQWGIHSILLWETSHGGHRNVTKHLFPDLGVALWLLEKGWKIGSGWALTLFSRKLPAVPCFPTVSQPLGTKKAQKHLECCEHFWSTRIYPQRSKVDERILNFRKCTYKTWLMTSLLIYIMNNSPVFPTGFGLTILPSKFSKISFIDYNPPERIKEEVFCNSFASYQ